MTFNFKNIFGKLLIALFVFVTFVAIFNLMWKYSGLRSKEKGFPDDTLQILVLTPEDIQIIYFQADLDAYIKNHPNYSFLIPPGQEKQVNDRLLALYRKKYEERGIDAYPWVKAEQIGEGRQYLEVGVSGHREQIVWYEATDKEIFPRTHQNFNVFDLLMMTALTTGLTAIFWLGVTAVWKTIENRINKKHK